MTTSPVETVLQGDDAHDRRTEQHQLHQVAVLPKEGAPPRLLGFLGELVRSVLLSPFEHRGGTETDCRIDVQLPAHIFGGQPVPLGRALDRRRGRVARWRSSLTSGVLELRGEELECGLGLRLLLGEQVDPVLTEEDAGLGGDVERFCG